MNKIGIVPNSIDESACTLQMLLDKADSYMYENKQRCKKYNH